jgi:hypothetical protein
MGAQVPMGAQVRAGVGQGIDDGHGWVSLSGASTDAAGTENCRNSPVTERGPRSGCVVVMAAVGQELDVAALAHGDDHAGQFVHRKGG